MRTKLNKVEQAFEDLEKTNEEVSKLKDELEKEVEELQEELQQEILNAHNAGNTYNAGDGGSDYS